MKKQCKDKNKVIVMRLINELKLDFKDVLIIPKRSTLKSRSEVSLEREYTFGNSKQSWKGVPIVVANMDTTGTFEMAKTLFSYKIITCIHKHYSLENWELFLKNMEEVNFNYFAVSIGITQTDLEKLDKIISLNNKIRFICLDVANGYTEIFIETVSKLRKKYPNISLIAGNITTAEMAEQLILSGADIVKAGIGGGSVCTTRIKTGVGYPQLSCVIECSDAVHGLKGRLMSDGGCTCSGDLSKAFGAGADFVMLGGMMAGHDESGGKIIEKDGIKYKEFYGMSSKEAMEKHVGKMASYRASEGKHVTIKYRGPISQTIEDILGGIRSTCTYVGANELKHLSKKTTFIRVNKQSNEVFSKN